MIKKFGIRMEGNENVIENIFKQYLESSTDSFSYLEIGAAGCVTLNSIKDIVRQYVCTKNYQIVGLDLENGWSLDWNTINCFTDLKINKEINNADRFQLVLNNDPRKLVRDYYPANSIDICFIDGCHGKPCVMADFLNIEPYIKSGGIVFFHDVGEIEQGTDWQHHCEEFINVRNALASLHLIPIANRAFRPGWNFIGENHGTRVNGGAGNSCIFVEKL